MEGLVDETLERAAEEREARLELEALKPASLEEDAEEVSLAELETLAKHCSWGSAAQPMDDWDKETSFRGVDVPRPTGAEVLSRDTLLRVAEDTEDSTSMAAHAAWSLSRHPFRPREVEEGASDPIPSSCSSTRDTCTSWRVVCEMPSVFVDAVSERRLEATEIFLRFSTG